MNDQGGQSDSSRDLGIKAEEAVGKYLAHKGFREITKNYRADRIGEIDLIFFRSEVLYFIEVRLRKKGGCFGAPEESIRPLKKKRIFLTAKHFVQVYQMENYDMAFLAASVLYSPGSPHIELEFFPF